MFLRRLSVHGRRMGEVRSGQQKCIRRGMLEPLILLNLEHLLSTPDMSRAALSRMQIIAAEDIGVASLGLVDFLMNLEKGWKHATQKERARRLIQASHLICTTPTSRFVPCWIVTLITGVPEPSQGRLWRTKESLLDALDQACAEKELQEAGYIVEEFFLRHPIEKEEDLPFSIHFERDVMSDVWDVLESHCPLNMYAAFSAWRRRFGTPSKETKDSRLFLYLAVLALLRDVPTTFLPQRYVSNQEVEDWLQRAQKERFELPDWMYDRHTRRGRQLGRMYEHFFEEGAALSNPSDILGESVERDMCERAKQIYIENEKQYGHKCGSKYIRRRWRAAAMELG